MDSDMQFVLLDHFQSHILVEVRFDKIGLLPAIAFKQLTNVQGLGLSYALFYD